MFSFTFILLIVTWVFCNAANWPHLSFDSKNFMCDEWDTFCDQILDEIGCDSDSISRISQGCYPTNNLGNDFVGTCTCKSPIYFDQAGARVAQQLMSNRIVADVPWMLEPWNTGPPYDLPLSYTIICNNLLDRLGCPAENKTVNATDYIEINGVKSTNMVCNCGHLTDSSKHVNRLIMDKFNTYNNQANPVFEDPIYLSVSMSICIVLICGKLGAILAVYLKLPPIIGFLLAGLGIQNILNPMFLKGAGYPFPAPAAELKNIALIIVLMRAGLSIKFDEIYATALPTLLLCTIPYLAEFFMWLYVGQTFFGWTSIDMGLWASIMAPLGPSVVISGLLLLLGNQKKDYGYPTKQILISTPIEAVLAIVFFGIFQNLEQTTRSTLYPWVNPLPLWLNCILVPVNILFSISLGIICGFFCSKYIDWRSQIKTDFIWVRANKNPQMGSSTADLVFVLLVLCYTMYSLSNLQYIQQCSGVLVVFTMCITVSILADAKTVIEIAQGLKGIWLFAEVFLFTLTGTSLSFNSNNGPLYGERGLSPSDIQKVLGMMFIGTCGRFGALGIIAMILYYYMPPHRQNFQWMGRFWLVCWFYQLPKATVQATLGTVAYYQNTIPGDIGLKEGLFIAQSTAFTVLIFAPLGALLTNFIGAPLAEHLTKLDKEAGWKHNEFRYSSSSPYYSPKPGEGIPVVVSTASLAEVESTEEVIDPKMHEPETIEDTAKAIADILNRSETFTRLRRASTLYGTAAMNGDSSAAQKEDDEKSNRSHEENFFTRLRRNTFSGRRRTLSGGDALHRSHSAQVGTSSHHIEMSPVSEHPSHGTYAVVPTSEDIETNAHTIHGSRELDATAEHPVHNNDFEIGPASADSDKMERKE